MKRLMGDMNLDTEKFPLGSLTREQIFKGFRILSEIQRALIERKNEKQIG